jgi:hypothetical protein
MSHRLLIVIAFVVLLTLALMLISPLSGAPRQDGPATAEPGATTDSPAPINNPGLAITLSGWFTIAWGDPQPTSEAEPEFSGAGPTRYYLAIADQSPVIRGQLIELILEEVSLPPDVGVLDLNRKRVTVEGAWLKAPSGIAPGSGADEQVELPVLHASSIQLEAIPGLDVPAAPGVSGSQPWVSILCKFSDVSTEPKTLSFFQNMYANSFPGLDHYWREQSYNIINVVGSGAFGWYTLPQPRSYYIYDIGNDGDLDADLGRLVNDCTAQANPYVYFPSYVGINMMFNDTLDCCAWGGGMECHLGTALGLCQYLCHRARDGARFWPAAFFRPVRANIR